MYNHTDPATNTSFKFIYPLDITKLGTLGLQQEGIMTLRLYYRGPPGLTGHN